jgi:hypothetical protein
MNVVVIFYLFSFCRIIFVSLPLLFGVCCRLFFFFLFVVIFVKGFEWVWSIAEHSSRSCTIQDNHAKLLQHDKERKKEKYKNILLYIKINRQAFRVFVIFFRISDRMQINAVFVLQIKGNKILLQNFIVNYNDNGAIRVNILK